MLLLVRQPRGINDRARLEAVEDARHSRSGGADAPLGSARPCGSPEHLYVASLRQPYRLTTRWSRRARGPGVSCRCGARLSAQR